MHEQKMVSMLDLQQSLKRKTSERDAYFQGIDFRRCTRIDRRPAVWKSGRKVWYFIPTGESLVLKLEG